MKDTLSLNDFTILMIATLADNSKFIDFANRDKRIAVIPVDYKQRIENILCAENGWKEEFSILINIDEYFEDHFAWEQQLATQIKAVIERLGKNFEYDFLEDSINISFIQKEIDFILSNYKDENMKNIMNHFTSLLSDFIYSRTFQEEFHDYSSRSVQYMKKLRRNI
ncbi:MAG: hypothetical protein IKE90_01285 [Bacilli bacterium]|nr:hypothetical protein [Bacilli bacterium]